MVTGCCWDYSLHTLLGTEVLHTLCLTFTVAIQVVTLRSDSVEDHVKRWQRQSRCQIWACSVFWFHVLPCCLSPCGFSWPLPSRWQCLLTWEPYKISLCLPEATAHLSDVIAHISDAISGTFLFFCCAKFRTLNNLKFSWFYLPCLKLDSNVHMSITGRRERSFSLCTLCIQLSSPYSLTPKN